MKWLNKNQNTLCLLLGIVIMVLTILPNLILGMDSVVTYHDQLDGELIAYILQAKNLFSGDVLPEFMGGMPKTVLTMPAPIFVLLFLGGNYFGALLAMQLIGRVVGFVGMYLLAKDRGVYPLIAAVVAVMYGLLPFLPVYGLSQYGIPLLIYSMLQIREKKYLLPSYCYVALYALGSSLVLVGFGILGMGLLWLVWDLWQQRKGHRKNLRGLALAWILLLGIYVVENLSLLAQMLGVGGDGVSHKAEYVLRATPFWSTFFEKILYGGQHSEGYQSILLPVILVTVAVAVLVAVRIGAVRPVGGDKTEGSSQRKHLLADDIGKAMDLESHLQTMPLCLGSNLLFALMATLWSVEPLVELRSNMGALGAFQLERMLWIAPCLWYLLAACGAEVLVECWKLVKKKAGKVVISACCAGLAVAVAVTGLQILLAGDVKSNIQKLRNPDYGILSFREYYAVGVLEQVEAFLEEQTGLEPSEYRVVSLGIDPAAALYHGFYCLDGYSNNYSLDYKHSFREVIAPELEKSEYLQEYFDEWGNRCYLFSAECPGYYTIEKNGFYFQDYQLNAVALKEMGCDYLFSAAYIMDGEKQGLKLLNEVPFETYDSYYRIYVYEICQ